MHTTTFTTEREVEHRFAVGDTIDIVYPWQYGNGHSAKPYRQTISEVFVEAHDAKYRYVSGGWDLVATIDDCAAVVVKFPCHLKVGDVLRGSTEDYTVISVDESKFKNVTVEYFVAWDNGKRHTWTGSSAAAWIERAELNPKPKPVQTLTYTITVETDADREIGAANLTILAEAERVAKSIRSASHDIGEVRWSTKVVDKAGKSRDAKGNRFVLSGTLT
jgi:hypothetical protein